RPTHRSARRGTASCRRTIPSGAREWLPGRRSAGCAKTARRGPVRRAWARTSCEAPNASWPCVGCSSLLAGPGTRGHGRRLGSLERAPELQKLLGNARSELFHYEVRVTYDTPEIAEGRRIADEAERRARDAAAGFDDDEDDEPWRRAQDE